MLSMIDHGAISEPLVWNKELTEKRDNFTAQYEKMAALNQKKCRGWCWEGGGQPHGPLSLRCSYQRKGRISKLSKTNCKDLFMYAPRSVRTCALSEQMRMILSVCPCVCVCVPTQYFLIPAHKRGQSIFLCSCLLDVTHTRAQLSAWALTWLTGRKNSFTKLHLLQPSRSSSSEWDRNFETERVKIRQRWGRELELKKKDRESFYLEKTLQKEEKDAREWE